MNNYSCGYPQQNRSRQMNNRENNNQNNCYCAEGKSALPEYPAVAMAYVPFQQRGEIYSFEKALDRGTLFPCLDKPFLMGCCR